MAELYKIANEYAALMSEDLPPELIADTLEGIEGEFTDKVAAILALCKNESAYADSLKEEASSLNERAKAITNKVERLRQYIADCMIQAEMKKVRSGVHEVTLRAASKVVEITDPMAIPVDLVEYETVVKPNKLEIKRRILAGEEIAGATVKDGKTSLIIK